MERRERRDWAWSQKVFANAQRSDLLSEEILVPADWRRVGAVAVMARDRLKRRDWSAFSISPHLRVQGLCLCNQPEKDQGGSRRTEATAVVSGLLHHTTVKTTFKAQLHAAPTWALAVMPQHEIIHEGYEVGAGNNLSPLLLTLFTGTLVTCHSCEPGGDRSQEAPAKTQSNSSWGGRMIMSTTDFSCQFAHRSDHQHRQRVSSSNVFIPCSESLVSVWRRAPPPRVFFKVARLQWQIIAACSLTFLLLSGFLSHLPLSSSASVTISHTGSPHPTAYIGLQFSWESLFRQQKRNIYKDTDDSSSEPCFPHKTQPDSFGYQVTLHWWQEEVNLEGRT